MKLYNLSSSEQDKGHERSGEWRRAILQDVDKIYVGRTPGRMVVYGNFAEPGTPVKTVFRPVLWETTNLGYLSKYLLIINQLYKNIVLKCTVMTHGDATNTFIAAASFGEGRIVAFSWKHLTHGFITDYHKNKQLNDNIVKWVTKLPDNKREDVNVINIDRMTNFEDVKKQFNDKPTIIAWMGDTTRNDQFMNSLSNWIEKGGSFVCGVTPHGWARNYKRSYQQIPIFRLLKVNLCSFEQVQIQRAGEPPYRHVFR